MLGDTVASLELRASRKDRSLLLEARRLCLPALEGEKKLQADWAVKETEASLARIEKALAEIQ